MKRTTFIIAFFLSFSITAHAQFFKKLGDKIVHTAEKTVTRKAEQKTKKETEKAFDSTFNKKRKSKENTHIPSVSNTKAPENYTFNYIAVMEMKTGNKIQKFDYYLTKKGDFFGMKMKDEKLKEDFMMVYDVHHETMFTFMENAGQKMKIGVKFEPNKEDKSKKFEIIDTGNTKRILGYNCKEYKITGEKMNAIVWVTKDVTIRFPNALQNDKKDHHEWMKDIDGWAMQMEMVDTSQRKPQTITMHCLSIEEKTYIINANEYQNIGR